MAEVFIIHRHPPSPPPPPQRPISNATSGSLQEEPEPMEEEFLLQPRHFVDFDSFSPSENLSNPFFFDDNTTSFDFGFDLSWESQNAGSGNEYPDCLFYKEEDDEQMNIVADLLESGEALLTEDPVWDFDSDLVEGSDLEFGCGPEIDSNAGMNFVSDTEEFEVNSGFIHNDDDDDDYVDSHPDDNDGGFGVIDNLHIGENERQDFEWEEVSERLYFDESENLNSLIDRIEEISVSLEIPCDGVNPLLGDEGEEEERNTAWEVLLAMDSLDMNFEFDNLDENNVDGTEVPPINLPEDYILTTEYDTLFDEVVDIVDNENALKGCRPAAISVVENLPSVVLTKEELEDGNGEVFCAVCKDDVASGDKLTRMPCCHLYHGDCIFPWLKITNTCPVCRYELPTDDVDYERRRIERGGSSGTAAEVSDGGY
ncbi:Ubiquitin--protein ligase [Handroanthus impetiginosus]|uniref:RING-type E3 ubiquitin transferase n=1 Tax=Handroanthus impetiginosus TaxID=429701 RepID=A0A2G9H5K8_9LAMI|nr:Ubiquitin--protein ligase [Handroanthus impetiginosus]